MTDIQIPLPQSHQKGMNGKFSPKNTLEIRGYSGNSGSSSANLSNTMSQNGTNANLASSVNSSSGNGLNGANTSSTNGKKPLKLIDKSQSTNIHLYPIRLNAANSEKDSYGTIVSFNLINNLSNINGKQAPSTTTNKAAGQINSNSKNFKTNESSNSVNFVSSVTNSQNRPGKENENNNLGVNNASFLQVSNSMNNAYANQLVNSHNGHSGHPWHDESNSGWTSTGVMSDRSSVYSIDDGDFDREASRKVTNQLKEIESILYEQNSTLSSNLIECKEWLEKFPHLRILGKQISHTRDKDDHDFSDKLSSQSQSIQGTTRNLSHQLNGTSNLNLNVLNIHDLEKSLSVAKRDAEANSVTADQQNNLNNFRYNRRREMSDLNNQTLYLNGTSLPIKSIDNNKSGPSEDYSYLEEEIIEQEGTYEELLAYDNQEEEYMFEHNKRLNLNKRRRHGLPPISPKAAMKDLVANMVFDYLWSELIKWSEPTIKAYYSFIKEGYFLSEKPQPKIDVDETPTASPRNGKSDSARIAENSSNDVIFANVNKSTNSFNKYDLLQQLNNNEASNQLKIRQTADQQSNVNASNAHSIASAGSSSNAANHLWGKPNVLLIKPFESNNNNTQTNPNLYNSILESKSSSLTPSLLSRDNSTLYAQSTKFAMNENNFDGKFNSYLANDGDIIGGFDDILTIKQLNRNGTTKTLSPITQQPQQTRIGSGNRRQQLSSSYKKRYSSIEVTSNSQIDKNNIVVHGAALAKPTSVGHLSEQPGNGGGVSLSFDKLNQNQNSAINSSSALSTTNSNQYSSMSNNNPTGANISRSNNSSSQYYHHLLPPNDESTFENDFHDYHFNNANENGASENTIDEINLLNFNNPGSAGNKLYSHGFHGHYGFNHHHHNHNSHSSTQQLPPIEKSLVLKPMRISSANTNLKQIKEKTERPMTSTATRHETSALALHKRSTTPSGLGSHGRAFTNMQITGVRLSADDSLYSHNHNSSQLTSNQLSNFLSTKPYNFSLNSNSSGANNGSRQNQHHQQGNNRRNSKDIQTILKLNQ